MDWVKAITFDFWGTLVDVDASGAEGMEKVLAEVGLAGHDAAALYADWDIATVKAYRSTTWRPYLTSAAIGLRAVLAPRLDTDAAARADWAALAHLHVGTMTSQAKPHPETPGVVDFLAERYPLMPITNMDTAYFRMNAYGHRFQQVTTAEEARAFKPQEQIFRMALGRLGVSAENVLHVSLSQMADIDGVKPLGFKCAWINRSGEGLSTFTPVPDYEFRDLLGVKALFGG